MANDIDLWQDIKHQERFVRYCKKHIKTLEKEFTDLKGNVRKEIEEIESWELTLKNAKIQLKNMQEEFNRKYINN